jgi:hypothetical protein
VGKPIAFCPDVAHPWGVLAEFDQRLAGHLGQDRRVTVLGREVAGTRGLP